MNMLAEQRYQEILAILRREGSVKSAQIRQALGVSGETVRRDLEAMESLGMLRRTHGGAMPAEPGEASAAYTPFYNRQQQNTGHKSQVAQLAADYIREGQSIALDSGTTALSLARVIRERWEGWEEQLSAP